MGRFPLNDANIKRITEMLEHQINEVKKRCAAEAYEYLIDWGYHAVFDSGEKGQNESGWSFYTAANWNCSINVVDKSMLSPKRSIEGSGEDFASREGEIDFYKARTVFESVKTQDHLFVTNTSPWISVLNDGGSSMDLFVKNSKPNHFMEKTQDHLKDVVEEVIKIVNKGCPNL